MEEDIIYSNIQTKPTSCCFVCTYGPNYNENLGINGSCDTCPPQTSPWTSHTCYQRYYAGNFGDYSTWDIVCRNYIETACDNLTSYGEAQTACQEQGGDFYTVNGQCSSINEPNPTSPP